MLQRVAKGASILASGVVAGQILVVASSPVLTRIYTPSDFGAFGVYSAMLYMLVAVASLRYEIAIPLVAKERDAVALAAGAIAVLLVSTIAIVLVMQISPPLVFPDRWQLYQWILPIGVFVAGSYNIAVNCCLRTQGHALIAKAKLLQAFGGTTAQLFGGFLSAGTVGLIGGQIIGIAAGTVTLLPLAHRARSKVRRQPSMRRTSLLLREQRRFACFDAPGALLAVANTHGPTLLVGIIFSPAAAGLFALVQRVVSSPMGIISSAISSSLLSYGREIGGRGEAMLGHRAAVGLMLVPPIASFSALLLMGSFDLVFGRAFSGGGAIAAWIILFASQKLIFDSSYSIFAVYGEQRLGLQLQLLLLTVRGTALALAAQLVSFDESIMIFSIASVVLYFFCIHRFLLSGQQRLRSDVFFNAADISFSYLIVLAAVKLPLQSTALALAILAYCSWTAFRIYMLVHRRKIVTGKS